MRRIRKAIIVESDNAVRQLESEILAGFGYKVIEFGDPFLALDFLSHDNTGYFALMLHEGRRLTPYKSNCPVGRGELESHFKCSSEVEKILEYAVSGIREDDADVSILVSDCYSACQKTGACFYEELVSQGRILNLKG